MHNEIPSQKQPLRWTIERGASEFDINPRTLSKRLKQNNDMPGGDGRYSTLQVARAAFGDLDRQKLRKVTLEANLLEMEQRRRRNELIEVEAAFQLWSVIAATMKRIILGSSMPPADQDRLLEQLSGGPTQRELIEEANEMYGRTKQNRELEKEDQGTPEE